MKRTARHCNGDIDAARTNGNLADAASRRRMRIRSKESHSWLTKTLKVKLMADAVACLGINDAILLGYRLEKIMIVGVLKSDLHRVMVHIRN